MSVFTKFIGSCAHFGQRLEVIESALAATSISGAERIALLVDAAYCLTFLNLPKGLAAAEEAIERSKQMGDEKMAAYALLRKSHEPLPDRVYRKSEKRSSRGYTYILRD